MALSKESRLTIIIMILLVVMFITGIVIRWDYISKEVNSTADVYRNYFNPDSIGNKK